MKTKLVLLASAALTLVGCGDDVMNVAKVRTVADIEDAGECAVGEMVLNLADSLVYACVGERSWVAVKGDAGPKGDVGDGGAACVTRTTGKGVEVVCDGEVLGTLANGPAARGCKTDSIVVDGISGIEIVCGNQKDTVLNGVRGDRGADCSAAWLGDSAAVVSCGNVVVDTLRFVEMEDGAASSFGGEAIFCGTTPYDTMTHFCDIRDSSVYKWVKIGFQTWMAENLNYVYKVNGAVYRNYCYNDSAQYCAKYGRLYTWGAAMDSATTGCGYGTTCAVSAGSAQGICPAGWHLPSQAEWSTLITTVGDSAGAKLKSISGWYSNGNGTDAYGFSALPSGDANPVVFADLNAGYDAYFWSSSEYDQEVAYRMSLYFGHPYTDLLYTGKLAGYAVRCLKD